MGLTPSFIIKHVRPLDRQAYDFLVSTEFIDYLKRDLHLSYEEILQLAAAWKQTAEGGEKANYEEAARAVTSARWSELYPTSASTVMFLSASQIASLSQTGERAGANQKFGWKASGGIRYAVTIRRNGVERVDENASGFFGATDAQSDVVHFDKLDP